MGRKRSIRALGLLLAVSLAAAGLMEGLSKRHVDGFEKVVIPPTTGAASNRRPQTIPGLFLSNGEREDRVPGQLQRFARCFFPQEASVKKADTNSIGWHQSRRYSKSYLERDSSESELFFDELITMSGSIDALTATVDTRVEGRQASDLVLTPQQMACLKSFRDDRGLDQAKRIYSRIVSLQERRERLVKGLIQFNQTSDEAFRLRLNELTRAVNVYQARFFLGFTMKRRRVSGVEFEIDDQRPIAMLRLRSAQGHLSDADRKFRAHGDVSRYAILTAKGDQRDKGHADRADQRSSAQQCTLSH